MHPPRGEIALCCAAFLEFVLIVFTIIIIPRFLLGWEGVTPFLSDRLFSRSLILVSKIMILDSSGVRAFHLSVVISDIFFF